MNGTHNKPESSADQDAWINFWERVRTQLGNQISLIPAMKPDEIEALTNAARYAQYSHFQALIFDKQVELELARGFPE